MLLDVDICIPLVFENANIQNKNDPTKIIYPPPYQHLLLFPSRLRRNPEILFFMLPAARKSCKSFSFLPPAAQSINPVNLFRIVGLPPQAGRPGHTPQSLRDSSPNLGEQQGGYLGRSIEGAFAIWLLPLVRGGGPPRSGGGGVC